MDDKRKRFIFVVLTTMVLAILFVVGYYWYENAYYISTEDAKVTGDLVKVAPMISGRIIELSMEEGQSVKKDQILGRIEMPNLPDSSLESSLIRAPIAGVIIKKQGTIGEIASPGQTLAMIVDTQKLYINANIEETSLAKVKKDQITDIKIDQMPDVNFSGKVKSVGEAANSTFALIPSSSGSFTKVVQKVMVKIEIDKNDYKILPGTNAVIKIHIRN